MNYKVCPKCGQPAVWEMRNCQRCGNVYESHSPPNPPASTDRIWSMWGLTMCSIVTSHFLFPLAMFLDGIAVLIAISLFFKTGPIDKKHATAKLVWEGIAMILALQSGLFSAASSGYTGGM